MKPRLIFISAIVFWLIIGAVVVRTNRLWLGSVTFHWSNLTRPNATFRWSTMPTGKTVVIPANSIKSFKIVVPRKFSAGELIIATASGQGTLTANIDAPAGKTIITDSTEVGGKIILPLQWDRIAVQTRTFNVDLMTGLSPIELKAISLKLH